MLPLTCPLQGLIRPCNKGGVVPFGPLPLHGSVSPHSTTSPPTQNSQAAPEILPQPSRPPGGVGGSGIIRRIRRQPGSMGVVVRPREGDGGESRRRARPSPLSGPGRPGGSGGGVRRLRGQQRRREGGRAAPAGTHRGPLHGTSRRAPDPSANGRLRPRPAAASSADAPPLRRPPSPIRSRPLRRPRPLPPAGGERAEGTTFPPLARSSRFFSGPAPPLQPPVGGRTRHGELALVSRAPIGCGRRRRMRLPWPLVASHLQCVKIGAGHVEEEKRGTEGRNQMEGCGWRKKRRRAREAAFCGVVGFGKEEKHLRVFKMVWPSPSRSRIDRSRNRGVVPLATRQESLASFQKPTLRSRWAMPSFGHAQSLQVTPSIALDFSTTCRHYKKKRPATRAGNSTCWIATC